MRLKWWTFLLTALLMIGGAGTGGPKAEEPPDEMVINNQGYRPERKGPVTFTHLNHAEDYEIACSDCHHEYEGKKNVWEEGDPVKKCIACHHPSKNKGNVKNLRLSFHKNCKNCHREMANEGISEDAPFRKCSECHEKGE